VQAAGAEQFEEALHEAHMPAMALSLSVAGIGILIAFLTYQWKKISAEAWAGRMKGLYAFLLNKWYFDELYGAVVVGGTFAFTSLLRRFDNTVVDGLVNGTASWTKGIVFGYNVHWKDRPMNSRVFLIVGMFTSGVVAWYAFMWLLTPGFTMWGVAGAGLGGLCAALLTFFFFWGGAGGFDKYVVDGLVNGVAYMSGFSGIVLRKFQSGRVQTYIVFVLIGVMVLFFMFR
jgi:NADH:ubiquinone oxidoreductase subunit 5 (subunit L)/multisubunit Na+/H+ antiporter MnhA subunit